MRAFLLLLPAAAVLTLCAGTVALWAQEVPSHQTAQALVAPLQTTKCFETGEKCENTDPKARLAGVLGQASNRRVVVFSKSYCGYSRRAKSLLMEHDIAFSVLELDQAKTGAAMQSLLKDASGQRTVPNVFVDGEHVGGSSELQGEWNSGAFQKRLEKAGVPFN
jgi:glutaredoxin 3